MEYCLTNQDYFEQVWREKYSDVRSRFWATVSPYIVVDGKHESRWETIPQKICSLIEDEPGCSNLSQLTQNIPFCLIKPIY